MHKAGFPVFWVGFTARGANLRALLLEHSLGLFLDLFFSFKLSFDTPPFGEELFVALTASCTWPGLDGSRLPDTSTPNPLPASEFSPTIRLVQLEGGEPAPSTLVGGARRFLRTACCQIVWSFKEFRGLSKISTAPRSTPFVICSGVGWTDMIIREVFDRALFNFSVIAEDRAEASAKTMSYEPLSNN